MGDLLRRAVYPVLLISIVGSLWRLASSQGDLTRQAKIALPALPPIHYAEPPDDALPDDPKRQPAPDGPGFAETDR